MGSRVVASTVLAVGLLILQLAGSGGLHGEKFAHHSYHEGPPSRVESLPSANQRSAVSLALVGATPPPPPPVMPANNQAVSSKQFQHRQHQNHHQYHQTGSAAQPGSSQHWRHKGLEAPLATYSDLSAGGSSQPRAHLIHQPQQDSGQQSHQNSGFLANSNLELALRQASGDESVFQPSPIISSPAHHSDWSLQTSPAEGARLGSVEQPSTVAPLSPPSTSPSTTEQSNSIVVSHEADSIRSEWSQRPAPQLSHQKEYQTNQMMSGATGNGSLQDNFSNQVIYEGPATAPPVGDFYFSSSERLPNNSERVPNGWW